MLLLCSMLLYFSKKEYGYRNLSGTHAKLNCDVLIITAISGCLFCSSLIWSNDGHPSKIHDTHLTSSNQLYRHAQSF
jgi:hypothetical protein